MNLKKSVEIAKYAEALLDDSDEHIDGHDGPDLRLHCILRVAEERLDAQVLLDPLKKQFHLAIKLPTKSLFSNEKVMVNDGLTDHGLQARFVIDGASILASAG